MVRSKDSNRKDCRLTNYKIVYDIRTEDENCSKNDENKILQKARPNFPFSTLISLKQLKS